MEVDQKSRHVRTTGPGPNPQGEGSKPVDDARDDVMPKASLLRRGSMGRYKISGARSECRG